MTRRTAKGRFVSIYRFAIVVLACVVATFCARGVLAADSVEPLSGKVLDEQMALPIGVTWSQVPLRKALRELSERQRVAIVVDRRIDPEQPLEVRVQNEPLRTALEQIASQAKLGFSMIGPVAYFGPTEVTAKLRTVAALREDEAKKLRTANRGLLRLQAWRWDDLTTPRELLDRLAQEAQVHIEGQERVPHDLWAGANLPPLAWCDRLTLIAAQFDLTFALDATGKVVALVPWPDRPTIERVHSAVRSPDETMRKWRALAPNSQIEMSAGKIVVRGTLEDHERIAGVKSVANPANPEGLIEQYTLTQQDVPLRKLLGALAAQLKLEVRIDEDALSKAKISLDQPVSFQVSKVSLDELIRAALKGSGLTFRRTGKVIEVRPE